jgi:hypothetical protein
VRAHVTEVRLVSPCAFSALAADDLSSDDFVSAADTFYACSNNATNRGRPTTITVNAPAACGPGETLRTWNQAGPSGPSGPQGPPGSPDGGWTDDGTVVRLTTPTDTVGTVSPSATLHVSGNALVQPSIDGNSTFRVLSATGDRLLQIDSRETAAPDSPSVFQVGSLENIFQPFSAESSATLLGRGN